MKATIYLFKILFFIFFLGHTGCSSLLYYPDRRLYVDPRLLEPVPEEKTIDFQNIKVHGWYFRSPVRPAKAVVLYFHGNGQNRSAHFYSLYWLIKEGYDLAIFDYLGYGQTAGEPNPENTVRLAVEIIRSVRNLNKDLPIVVYGNSLGGAIALRAVRELQQEFKPALVIADSTFLSYKKAARAVMSRSALLWALQPLAYVVMSDEWAPRDLLRELNQIPILVIHSRSDEVIPFELGEQVFAYAPEPKEFWIREKTLHNQGYEDAEGTLLKKKLLSILPPSTLKTSTNNKTDDTQTL
ncbi:MAG: alpha/beta hydrolase [Pseudobdellovibrionaceae bacterium]